MSMQEGMCLPKQASLQVFRQHAAFLNKRPPGNRFASRVRRFSASTLCSTETNLVRAMACVGGAIAMVSNQARTNDLFRLSDLSKKLYLP